MYRLRGRIAARVRRRELTHVPAEPVSQQQPEARPQIGVEAGGVESPRVARGTGGTKFHHPQTALPEPPQQFDIIEERPARAAADCVPALAAQNDPRVAERRPGRVDGAPRLEGAPVRAPPLEPRRVADDSPAPRQRRDGIFRERRVGVEQQERVAARSGHGVDEGPPRPPPADTITAAPWSRAISAVASVEPPSATITSSVAPSHAAKALRALAMHRPMQPASFLAAMHTEMRAKPFGATAWGAIVPLPCVAPVPRVCTSARPVQRRGIERYTCFSSQLDVLLGCLGRLALTTARRGLSPPALARPLVLTP